MDLVFEAVPHFAGHRYIEWLLLRQSVLRTPLHKTFTLDDLMAERDQHHVVMIDTASQRILGGYLLKSHPDHTAQLRQMAVDAAYQGAGLGTRLMHHAEQTAIGLGLTRLTMQARLGASGFYQKLGYKRLGLPYVHLDLDHVNMEKLLN